MTADKPEPNPRDTEGSARASVPTPRAPTPASAPADDAAALPRPASLAEVKGWFDTVDQLVFDWLLARQLRLGISGDLLELGSYLGKSAVFIGTYQRLGESFTVCDLFDAPAEDDSNRGEMRKSYSTLTRRAFEANYLAFHDELPTIVQAPTATLAGRLTPGTFRFVHVDASHLYEHVERDIDIAREALFQDGIVALDDYRAEHTPGVAAATWEAVFTKGLHPIAITGKKFYGTWGDPEPVQRELRAWLSEFSGGWHEAQSLGTRQLIRLSMTKPTPAPQPVSRHAGRTDKATLAKAAGSARTAPAVPGQRAQRTLARKIAVNVLPPVIARPIARYLRSK